MFAAPIPAPPAPRTRADERLSLTKRIEALALALFALVGLVCWRIYETTPIPPPQPPRAVSWRGSSQAGDLRHFSFPRPRPTLVRLGANENEQLYCVRLL